MFLCLPFKNFEEDIKDNSKKSLNPYVLAVPAFCDVVATIFDSAGLFYVSISLISLLIKLLFKNVQC